MAQASKHRRAEPLIVLLNARHPGDIYGWARIDVIAFNVDGSGLALARVYSELDAKPELHLYGADMQLMLEGDDHGERAYVEAPDGWDGKTMPDVEHSDDHFGSSVSTWGRTFCEQTSDEALFRASHDERKEIERERTRYRIFDQSLVEAGLPPRRASVYPSCYGGERSPVDDLLHQASEAAAAGDATRCARVLRKAKKAYPELEGIRS
jgi:hypothetical protein